MVNTAVSMCKSPYHEFMPASPEVLSLSCLSHLDGLGDKKQVTVYLLFRGVLFPQFVQNSTQHPCIVPI